MIRNYRPGTPATSFCPRVWRSRSSSLLQACRLDVVELRELALQICIAVHLDLRLIGRLAIARIEPVHHVHPADHFSERRKAALVELRIVLEVDEKLRRAR